MEFNEKLRSYGLGKYGSIKKFAEALNIPSTSLSQYLNGKTKPGFDIFRKLAETGCDVNELFGAKPATRQIIMNNAGFNEECEKIIEVKDEQIKELKEIITLYKNIIQKYVKES